MINEIRIAFLDNLKNLTWMDRETREAAINKANAITDMIGESLKLIPKSLKINETLRDSRRPRLLRILCLTLIFFF